MILKKLTALIAACFLSMPLAYASRHLENVHPDVPDSVDSYLVSILRTCEIDTEIITTTTISETDEVYDFSGPYENWYVLTITSSYTSVEYESNHTYDTTLRHQLYELRVGETVDLVDESDIEVQDLPGDEEFTAEYGDVSNPDYGYWISIVMEITYSGTGSVRRTTTEYF